ncbi:MAG: cell wall-binding repeat-containing protein [Clostridioides difficile]|nr:cell wall-binding repeat-containing protein [Clostridioides sp.]MBS5788589.1 cell wall-binding repeat-containing protein [Clostridioides difficile]
MRIKKCFILFLLGVVLFNLFGEKSFAFDYEQSNDQYKIFQGKDRFETAIITSQNSFKTSDKVIIADGYDYTSLITALSVSSREKAPILYSNNGHLTNGTENEIKRLKAKEIYCIGEKLNININNIEIKKNVNKDIYNKNFEANKNDRSDEAILVSGENYADAISASSISYKNSLPIYITSRDRINTNIEEKLKEKNKIYIIGGKNSISDTIADKFDNVIRISGENRFETSKLVNKRFFNTEEVNVIAKGNTYPDAICGAYIASNENSSIVLVDDNDKIDLPNNVTVIGGVNLYKNNVVYLNPHQDDEILTMGLTLLRDIQSGKNINFVQVTDGEKTSALFTINERLKRENRKILKEEDIIIARNNELALCLSKLGFSGKVHYLNYENLNVSKEDIYYSVDKILLENNLSPLNTEIKTLSKNEYDTSKGNYDHFACTDAVNLMSKDKFYKKTYISNKPTNCNHKLKSIIPTDEEKRKLVNALNAYGVWNPDRGFYSVGYISSPYMFDEKLKDLRYYEEYN